MNIALLTDDYLPNSTRIHAKMMAELANEFRARGHYPFVITPGRKGQKSKLFVERIDGIDVWRFRTGNTRGGSKVKRAVNETLLPFNAWFAINKKLEKNGIDLLINYSPTIFWGVLVKFIKKKFPDCRSYLVLRDLFPQWAIDQGLISQGTIIEKYFRFFEKKNYNSSDYIGLMSKANIEVFESINEENVKYQKEILFNWSRINKCDSPYAVEGIKSKYNIEDKVVFFYGGNIGHAQDMENLMRLAKSMAQYKSAYFLFIGQGDEFELINSLKQTWSLDNVGIYPSISQEEFELVLQVVDIGLFSLSKEHSAHNFPGKLLGYMKYSIPILGSVNIGNDLVDFVNGYNAGKTFVNGEDSKLLRAAKQYLYDKQLRIEHGENAQRLLIEYFSVESAADKILSKFE